MRQGRRPDQPTDRPATPDVPTISLDSVVTDESGDADREESLEARVARQRELIETLREVVAVQRSWIESHCDRMDEFEARLDALETVDGTRSTD